MVLDPGIPLRTLSADFLEAALSGLGLAAQWPHDPGGFGKNEAKEKALLLP